MNKLTFFLQGLCLILLCHCNSNKGLSKKLSAGSWVEIESSDASLPIKRHEAAFVGVGDNFYLLGGRRINPVSIFNLKSQKWTDGAASPIELHHFQPVVIGQDIYIIGALTGPYPGETPVPNILIYHTESDTWEQGPSIPENRQRGGAGAVLYDGKIYLVCGIKDGHRGDHKNWLDVYDPITGEWEQLADAPRPRDHFQAAVVGDRLFALAGRTTMSADNPFKHTIGEVDVYDFQTKTWSTIDQSIPTQRAGNYVQVVGDEILVFGGETYEQEQAHSEVEALNVHDFTWRALPAMLQGRHGTGAILYQNQIYTASGCGKHGGQPELTSMECFVF